MWRSLLVVVSVVAAGAAQRVAEGPEPNSSIATATVLPLGREAFGVLAAGDSDWYRVTLVVPTDLRAETGPGYGPQVGDTWLVLLDAAGSPLRADDDGVGAGFYSRLDCPGLAAGTYYLAVEAGSQALANGSYSLDVRGAQPVNLTAPPVVAEAAENNDPRQGGVATTVALPARCNGLVSSIGAGGDWDFWRFQLATESFVRARVDATAAQPLAPHLDDPVLYLFDGGAPPALLMGPVHGSNFGVWDAALDARLAPGTYQIAVRGQAGSIAGHYYLDLLRSDAASVVVHAGGCGGRVLDVATTSTGPAAPLRTERPTIGTTWCVRGAGLGANGFVFHVVGFAATFVDLTPFGAPGCALEVVYVDTPLQLADGTGATTFAVTLPEDPALLGATLESQLAVFDLSNALGITLSNRVSALLGP